MKILHLVHQYLPEYVGGTELYTHWVTQRQAKRGHQIDIFYRRFAPGIGQQHRLEAHDVRVWAAWAGPFSPAARFMATFGDTALTAAFKAVVGQVQPDLVHIQHLLGLPLEIVAELHRQNLPFVITLHDYWWVCANAQLLTNYNQQLCDGPQAYLNCARCALARAGQPNLWPALPPLAGLLAWRNHRLRAVLEAAHTLIAPTDFVRRWYEAHGLPADKLHVLSHGLDAPSTLAPTPHKTRPLRIAYIGGLSRQKGIHILLEAFQKIDAGAELWIAGDEKVDPAYAARLRALASPGVQFLGQLSREAVWKVLSQVDAVAVPSLWYETFSFIVSEAFAANVPVLASRLGPLADRVTHEVDGLLIPAGDVGAWQEALRRCLEPGFLSHLQAGIQPVFTLDEHVSRLEAIYRRALLAHYR